MLKTCIDSNVWISGVVFGGPPGAVAMAALDRKFEVICSRLILEEVERTLEPVSQPPRSPDSGIGNRVSA
jgi:predicted nucleic acid-binding protein